MLKGKQKKLDKNNNGRIDAEDFKLLKANKPMKARTGKSVGRREEQIKKQNPHSEYDKKGKLKYTAAKMGRSIRGYGAARTSGSGLMDEQMAPGKVINARVGKSIKKDPTKPISSVKPKVSAGAAGSGMGKLSKLGQVLKSPAGIKGAALLGVATGLNMLGKKYLEKKRKEKEEMKKEGSMKSPFIPKKMGGGMMNKPMGYSKGMSKEDIMQEGKRVKAAGKAVFESIKDKNTPMKRERLANRVASRKNKKMGGGMMNKPMGYKSGTMVMARGCKLGRKKATKIT